MFRILLIAALCAFSLAQINCYANPSFKDDYGSCLCGPQGCGYVHNSMQRRVLQNVDATNENILVIGEVEDKPPVDCTKPENADYKDATGKCTVTDKLAWWDPKPKPKKVHARECNRTTKDEFAGGACWCYEERCWWEQGMTKPPKTKLPTVGRLLYRSRNYY